MISHWPVGNMSWWEFPSDSKQGDPKNWSTVVSYLGETSWKPEISLSFHTGESWKPERSSFLSWGNLWEIWGFHVVSLMFTYGNLRFPCGFPYVYMGKLEVSMWFPLCLHWETRVSLWFPSCFPLETWGFHVVSPYFPYGETTSWPEFPCDGSM